MLVDEVDKLNNKLTSRQNNKYTIKLVQLCPTYDTNADVSKPKLGKKEKREKGLHAWNGSQWNSCKKGMETLKYANTFLCRNISNLTVKARSECLKIH